MIRVLERLTLAVLSLCLLACAATPVEQKRLSISGVIEVPIPFSDNKYWLDDGPLLIVSREPLVTYRVMDKEEIEFAGSEKPVYEFIESSFSDPESVVEESFNSSHADYEFEHRKTDGVDFFVLSKPGEAKVYIASKGMTFGVEVIVEGEGARSMIETVVSETVLTKGG